MDSWDPIEEIYTSKRRRLQKSLEIIVLLVKERQNIRNKNLRSLNKEISYLRHRFINIHIPKYNPLPELLRSRELLRQEIQSFEKEKRNEIVSCWRDILNLKIQVQNIFNTIEEQERTKYLPGLS